MSKKVKINVQGIFWNFYNNKFSNPGYFNFSFS